MNKMLCYGQKTTPALVNKLYDLHNSDLENSYQFYFSAENFKLLI